MADLATRLYHVCDAITWHCQTEPVLRITLLLLAICGAVQAGGWVSGDGRLGGKMQVSRSFGDAALKKVRVTHTHIHTHSHSHTHISGIHSRAIATTYGPLWRACMLAGRVYMHA